MHAIDKFLNNITTYRLVVYALSGLTVISIGLAFLGRLSFSPTSLVISLSLILTAAYATDRLLARLYKTPSNMESALITAFIIFLIVQPANSITTGLALMLAGALSSLSKFLLSWNGKHLFNPAAFAATVLGFTGLQATTWWIGSSVLWPFTLILGLAIVRKIRRLPLVATFTVVSIGLQFILFAYAHQPIATGMKHALLASPLIFLATIMLTEPATMPPRRNLQIIFAALIAVLYVTAWKLGPIVIYPEVALLLGNIFAYLVSPKFKIRLRLKEVQRISHRVYNYVFQPEKSFNFLPGQYMEWTLAGVPYDNRGNRRTFTIASSPTESNIQLGLKYYEPASTYKATFESLQPGDVVHVSQLAGNFTCKGDEKKKLVFIAGGIGVTPFRSMIKYMADKNMQVNIILLYIVSDPHEFAYVREFTEAARIGVKMIPIVTNLNYRAPNFVTTKVNARSLREMVADYKERKFYISGPNPMVDATKEYLHELGITNKNIKTDHFSGY